MIQPYAIPATIRAEAEIRGFSLTGSNRVGSKGTVFWETTCGREIGFNYRSGRYVFRGKPLKLRQRKHY